MKWDSGGYWLKARAYQDRAQEYEHSDPRFGFYSSLSLEFLARSVLTSIHPVLNADPRNDDNLLYALGFDVTAQPRSLPAHAVFLRLEKTVKAFGKTQRELCDWIALQRNEELHTANPAFEGLKDSKWLPRYYDVCRVLCKAMGKTLADLVGEEHATAAIKLIDALNKDIESAVKSKIAAHAKVFAEKTKPAQKELQDSSALHSKLLAEQDDVTTHACPACESLGTLKGDLIKEFKAKYENESLVIDHQYLATSFKCHACDLELHTVEELAHSGIEPTFIKTTVTDLHSLFEAEDLDVYMNM